MKRMVKILNVFLIVCSIILLSSCNKSDDKKKDDSINLNLAGSTYTEIDSEYTKLVFDSNKKARIISVPQKDTEVLLATFDVLNSTETDNGYELDIEFLEEGWLYLAIGSHSGDPRAKLKISSDKNEITILHKDFNDPLKFKKDNISNKSDDKKKDDSINLNLAGSTYTEIDNEYTKLVFDSNKKARIISVPQKDTEVLLATFDVLNSTETDNGYELDIEFSEEGWLYPAIGTHSGDPRAKLKISSDKNEITILHQDFNDPLKFKKDNISNDNNIDIDNDIDDDSDDNSVDINNDIDDDSDDNSVDINNDIDDDSDDNSVDIDNDIDDGSDDNSNIDNDITNEESDLMDDDVETNELDNNGTIPDPIAVTFDTNSSKELEDDNKKEDIEENENTNFETIEIINTDDNQENDKVKEEDNVIDGDVYHIGGVVYSSSVTSPIHNILKIEVKSNGSAIIREKDDSYVDDESLKNIKKQLKEGIKKFLCTSRTVSGFAALKDNGTVVSWISKNEAHGYEIIYPDQKDLTRVEKIFSASDGGAFAALKEDGSVVTWGVKAYGGDFTYSDENTTAAPVNSLASDVVDIFSTGTAFAALKKDDKGHTSVVTWGSSYYGGNSSEVQKNLIDIDTIIPLCDAFIAIKNGGVVAIWGDENPNYGYHYVQNMMKLVQDDLKKGVKDIRRNTNHFMVLKDDDSVLIWKMIYSKTYIENEPLKVKITRIPDVEQVVNGSDAFAILKKDKTLLAVGDEESGGDLGFKGPYTTEIKNDTLTYLKKSLHLPNTTAANAYYENHKDLGFILVDVKKVVPLYFGFAALKENGSVIFWGSRSHDVSSEMKKSLEKDVADIFVSDYIFAALKSNGSVVVDSWGIHHKGYSPKLKEQLKNNVFDTIIPMNSATFKALNTTDGSVVVWGSNVDEPWKPLKDLKVEE